MRAGTVTTTALVLLGSLAALTLLWSVGSARTKTIVTTTTLLTSPQSVDGGGDLRRVRPVPSPASAGGGVPAMADPGPLRVLAFGDSLTEGLVTYVLFHAYSKRLQQRLGDALPRGAVTVHNQGKSGESLHYSMPLRFNRLLGDAEKAPQSCYEVIVILGGSNDIFDEDADTLSADVQKLVERALRHQTARRVVVLTVPENAAELRFPQMRETRLALNAFIRQLVETKGSEETVRGVQRLSLVDFASDLPQFSLSEEEQKRLWEDGLHLTAEGYDRLADLVFDGITRGIDY